MLRGRSATPEDAPTVFDVAVLPRGRRVAAAALRLCAGAGLLWLGVDMWLRVGLQVQSLSQLWWFAGAVVAPSIVAWMIVLASRANMHIEGAALVVDQRRHRTEIPLASIAALQPWRIPLPGTGIDLQLASGRRWTQGLALTRPQAFARALAAAGAPVRLESRLDTALARFAEARAAAARPRFDSPLVKFLLFPLLPALIAFRLHQVIAFGGTFGEYYTYGPRAYFAGLLIWWASWSIGLMLFAAVLRIVIEAGSALALASRPDHAAGARDALEWLGRLAYYIGVPLWLALRLMSQ